jgi:hypothetical protein
MIVPILALAMMQTAPGPFMNEGAYLYRSCQAWIRVAEADPNADIREDLVGETFCVAYISGFVDGTGTTKRGACLEPKTSVE